MSTGNWVRACVSSVVVLLSAFRATGATIEVSPLDSAEQAVVSLLGPLEIADIEQFRTKTSAPSKAIVVLGSDGGSLIAGY